MRFRIIYALLLLSGCGQPEAAEVPPPEKAREDGRIECALGGAAAFARVCAVDRALDEQGLVLTIRGPEGGFRRLRVTKDGRGVVAADGAAPAAVKVIGERMIEVAIGGDRYRLPATVR